MPKLEILKATQWQDWLAHPIAGDASARTYHRLTSPAGEHAILMQDPPGDGCATVAFEQIAIHLCDHGFSAPSILFHASDNGTMVLSDLGRHDVASWLTTYPEDEVDIYQTITTLLVELCKIPAPRKISAMTHEVAAQSTDLATINYAAKPELAAELGHIIWRCYDEHVSPELTLCLRDFHAQNLIWRPDRKRHDRLGLLDFQDACLAPAGYDLMSLLRDVRRDVPPDLARQMITRFQNETGGPSDAHLACVGAQRNLRILGVFARLSQSGKPQYQALIPRVWHQLMIDLDHPALHHLRIFVTRHLPQPEGP